MILIGRFSDGQNSAKNVDGVMVLSSAHRLMVVYICTKIHENILYGIKVIERTPFSWENFQRGIIP